MIHPLSSEKEIEFYLKESGSIFAVTLDQFYHKFEAIRQNVTLDNIILASIPDALSKPVRVGYMLTEGRKQAKIPKDAPVLRWNEFLRRGRGYHWTYRAERRAGDEAVILYSGRHHRRHQGHPAYESELQRSGKTDHRHQPHVPPR